MNNYKEYLKKDKRGVIFSYKTFNYFMTKYRT